MSISHHVKCCVIPTKKRQKNEMQKFADILVNMSLCLKAYFSKKPPKKIFRLLGGKIKFELALQPSTASTAKI